ncbi:MAG: hypothetical protein ACRENH_08915, partial [Gemmatimonadaceae bacterium]
MMTLMIGFSLLGAALVVQASQPAPVVTISAAELARAPHLTIAREPVWRVGGDADGPYGFARMVGGTFKRGGVAILESNPPEVRLYDNSGKHLSSFGRKGRGPGEFENLQRLVPHVGDSMVVAQINRVSVFDVTGRHGRTVSTANAANVLATPYRMLSDGSLLAATRPMPTPQDRTSQREGVRRDSTRIVVLAPDGANVVMDLGRRLIGETVVARSGQGWIHTAPAFGPSLLMEGGDSLVFLLQTDAPTFDVLRGRSGQKVRTISMSLTPRAVTQRDRDEFARARRTGAAKGPNAALAVKGTEDYLKVMKYPDKMP